MLELPRVKRFILKHFQNVDRVLTNLERTSVIISSEKSKFYITDIEIVRFIYNANNRYLFISKIATIIK